jgi:cellulose synthase/poly-beta-1,6-N-acetylglucosamine synthase-like glycosyltransferase
MIDIIITSYNEPKSTLRAVNAFLNQNTDAEFRIIICDPFEEVRDFIKKNVKDKRVGFFLDPGEGKSYALNLLFEKLKSDNKDDILLLTDGDVYVSYNTLKDVSQAFGNQEIGCITGKPVSIDEKDTKFGYWSHLLFSGIDKVRKKLSEEGKFFECSGYLFAIRKGVIDDFPLDVSEDSVIPYLFWKKGYKIKYLPEIEVYVKNPDNFTDWESQKIRNIKGHENLNKFFPDMPRTKTFWNEIKYGFFHTLLFPKNFKEFSWTIELLKSRYKIYHKAFKDLNKEKTYSDGWRETEIKSTKTLDYS